MTELFSDHTIEDLALVPEGVKPAWRKSWDKAGQLALAMKETTSKAVGVIAAGALDLVEKIESGINRYWKWGLVTLAVGAALNGQAQARGYDQLISKDGVNCPPAAEDGSRVAVDVSKLHLGDGKETTFCLLDKTVRVNLSQLGITSGDFQAWHDVAARTTVVENSKGIFSLTTNFPESGYSIMVAPDKTGSLVVNKVYPAGGEKYAHDALPMPRDAQGKALVPDGTRVSVPVTDNLVIPEQAFVTPELLAAMGPDGVSALLARIAAYNAETFQNSGMANVSTTEAAPYVVLNGFTENDADWGAMLNALTNSPDVMLQMANSGAKVAVLYVNSQGYCGVAYLGPDMRDPNALPNWAEVVNGSNAGCEGTGAKIHEEQHLLSIWHQLPGDQCPLPPTPAACSDSAVVPGLDNISVGAQGAIPYGPMGMVISQVIANTDGYPDPYTGLMLGGPGADAKSIWLTYGPRFLARQFGPIVLDHQVYLPIVQVQR